ncbi:uncharacterized protein LOC132757041 isoform X1 [Ruditapes philippinarum]|uniref:uncharacterized protein LOC132757041 isoform X1 n=1 Tax=Ruditapes philippinarum TaxID=129788 RepID=UPI00295A917F|nr:uncharacterized protein LOC132757041 isoform X1 [Ruditapes philippinarum]XP_060604203.1 uncharacterized protein LOC132757041 isoform X1 [Ruditapes philippinarum]
MNIANIVILQLCIVFVSCDRLSPLELKQQLQEMPTVTEQDIEMMKEGIRNNAEGIKVITKGIQNIEEQFKSLSDLIHETLSASESTTISKEVTSSDEPHKKCELSEDLKSNIEKLASCAENNQNDTNKIPSVGDMDILTKTESVLNEVLKGQSIISEKLLAFPKPQKDPENKVGGGCFKLVDTNEPDVEDDNDNKCFNISARPDKRVTFHCGNRNSRIADAVVSEIGVTGRIEVRYNNFWGTVCYMTFSHEDGNVACRSAGFARGVRAYITLPGSGQIWLSNLHCKGTESDLFDCEREFPIGGHSCTHSMDSVVTCFWLP